MLGLRTYGALWWLALPIVLARLCAFLSLAKVA